jgi:glycine betaine/proline transport system substrate-binding protein
MTLKISACAWLVGLAALAPGLANAAPTCEVKRPVVFAGLDWDSNAFHVAVARFILDHGYGCKSEVLPGTTIPLLNGMARGDVDVTMELWKDNLPEAWEAARKGGKSVELGINFDDAVQGWFVPRYVVEGPNAPAPGLKSVFDLPKYKEIFRDPEDPGKGRFYNGVAGWVAETVNTKKLKAYGLDDDFTNFHPGSGAALSAAIASAYARQRPILYYYWGPTWVMGLYDGVMLDEPAYDPAGWKAMAESKSPTTAVGFPPMEVWVVANAAFIAQAPQLKAFLSRYRTTSAVVSKALVAMRDAGGANAPEVAAKAFLKERPEVWHAWVPGDVAARVDAAIK